MKILADSHVLLWWLDDPTRIALPARAAIADPANLVFFSAASIWEIGLKASKGKLRIDGDIVTVLQADGFEPLPITMAHAARSLTLPDTHGDPFDRMLIAQALADGLLLVTRDRLILQYDVPTLEA
ncbi:MAG: type II toxin-antitoxin system VapC family toxin [Opitutaceae bacterium]|nr:type II toxin-antitoxin system VapC family toxin [Opitutaceae bacterium]